MLRFTQEFDEKSYNGQASGRKHVKQKAMLGPAVDKDIAHEAVGLKPATLIPKEIPIIKKKNHVLQFIKLSN